MYEKVFLDCIKNEEIPGNWQDSCSISAIYKPLLTRTKEIWDGRAMKDEYRYMELIRAI